MTYLEIYTIVNRVNEGYVIDLGEIMKTILGNAEEILNQHVIGFHQYVLEEPVHLQFVSQNLCDLTGYSTEELLSDTEDLYMLLVYPADRNLYLDFIKKLAQQEQTLTLQYRIVQKDGTLIYVNDTMTSKRLEDRTMAGYSSLSDITQVKEENNNLRFLNDTIPCGFLKYTCEKTPKVTYFNDQMLKIMGFPENMEEEWDTLEQYKENVFLMIPPEDRKKFSHFLEQVYTKETTIAGEIDAVRYDGARIRLYGWVTKCTNEQGEEEYQSACMDVTERHRRRQSGEMEKYIRALTEVYDKIFEYDFSKKTVTCLYGENSVVFKHLQNIPMQFQEATEQWITNNVVEEEREAVVAFFQEYYKPEVRMSDGRPPQIQYHAVSSSGEIKRYTGIFLKKDDAISLYCCRCDQAAEEVDSLKNENQLLKNMNENMQKLVMSFAEGIVAFKVEQDQVTPLYLSDNVCDFFGYTREEWVPMMKQRQSIKDFVVRSRFAYEDFLLLLEDGEAEFEYFDKLSQKNRRIKAICSRKNGDETGARYVMLYNINENMQTGSTDSNTQMKVHIRTFGYFDVFIGDKPVPFRNKKSKELFALLVDRRGGYVTSEEAISFLWEDEAVNAVTLARYRKVALRLKNILEEYGIADIVEAVDGKRRIVVEKVQCDLYDYLSQKEEYAQLFKGSYLSNYSWGETTLGELLNQHMY